MAIIQPHATTTDWAARPATAVSDVLAKSASKSAPASLVTTERDGYTKTANVTAERDGYGKTGLVTTEQNGGKTGPGQAELREVFDDFVGQTFYGQMLSAMRKTVDKPAYFDGGHAEEVFQAQLDQTLAERLADATAEQFTGPMFELFNMQRQ